MRSIAELNIAFERSQRAAEFTALCRFLALGRDRTDSLLFAEQAKAPERVIQFLKKAVEGSISAISGGWGSQLGSFAQISDGFIQSLSTVGVFDAILPFSVRCPLRTRLAVVVGRATGNAVSEGTVKPAGELALSGGELDERKVSSFITITEELARLTPEAGLQLLHSELQTACAGAVDEDFLDLVLDGVSPIPSTGSVLSDLSLAAESIVTGSSSKLFAITSSVVAKRIALKPTAGGQQTFPQMGVAGGEIAGIEFLVSDELGDTSLVLLDAKALATNPGVVFPGSTNHALIDMSGTITSLFQTNQRSLRIERTYGAELIRAGVALIGSVDYANNAS